MNEYQRAYNNAKRDGRICSRCKWLITKKNWEKGYRLCSGCYSALQGVNISGRWGKWRDEPLDKTGEFYE